MNAISRIGLPKPADPGETILWQGRPTWRSAAMSIWHVRLVAAYFLVLLVDGAVRAWHLHWTTADAFAGEAKLLFIGMTVVGMLVLLSWLTHRSTLYTITDRRVVMRFGIALQATLAIPFGAIAHVGIRVHRDHTGDLALRLIEGQRVMYLKLWPHVRPWSINRPEPMLRLVPQAGVVGGILCRAVTAAAEARLRADAVRSTEEIRAA